MNIYNKLPCDIKCLIIDKVSQDNHKELMKELTTHKSVVRCELCSSALKHFNYEVYDSTDGWGGWVDNNNLYFCCRHCEEEEELKYRTIPDYFTPWDNL
jgi:hypothetical protein